MADNTKIEWANATANYVNGCSVISPGCTNCFAMRLAGTRMKNHPTRAGLTIDSKAGPVWNGTVRPNDKVLAEVLGWKAARRIFWNAHGDLFHENVSDDIIDRQFAVMALTPHHTHMVLTKRSARMREYFHALFNEADARLTARITSAVNFALIKAGRTWGYCGSTSTHVTTISSGHGAREPMMLRGTGDGGVERLVNPHDEIWVRCSDAYAERLPEWMKSTDEFGWNFKQWPLPNVWLGVSVEDQARADERIPDLLATPAAIRFISAEPLLGPVDLSEWLVCPNARDGLSMDPSTGQYECCSTCDWTGVNLEGPNWVIAGGESGPNARPMHPDWARSLRDQCAAAGVAFHFKQWGEWLPMGQSGFTAWNAATGPKGNRTDAGKTLSLGYASFNDGAGGAETSRIGPVPTLHNVLTIGKTSGHTCAKVGKAHAGRLLDRRTHDEFPA